MSQAEINRAKANKTEANKTETAKTDGELVQAFCGGDEAAFGELYRRYQGGVYRSAFLIVGNSSDSENVLQDTFIKAWQNLHSLRDPARFQPWLWRIMVRTAWACCKKRREEPRECPEPAGVGESLLDGVLRNERRGELLAAVDSLGIKQRTVVILYYYDEMSVQEIAEATGALPGTVKSRLWAARRQLKKQLEQGGFGR